MHAEVVLGTEGPHLPEALDHGLLCGVGDGHQSKSRVLSRVRAQGIAVPVAIGEGDIDVLRLLRLIGGKGHQS
jgi:hypothetical protein